MVSMQILRTLLLSSIERLFLFYQVNKKRKGGGRRIDTARIIRVRELVRNFLRKREIKSE
jgi:hypothetical protein